MGTGRIAVPVAAAGVRVIGIDSSAGMLDICREQAELAGVAGCSTCGSATARAARRRAGEPRALPVPGVSPPPWRGRAAGGAARRPRLLVPGGRLVFDVFTPSAEDIEETHGRWLEREPGIFERADWDTAAGAS